MKRRAAQKKQQKSVDSALAHFIFNEEQVLLSKERTALSFMRTGLGFIGVGVAILSFLSSRPLLLIGVVTTATGFYEVYRAYRLLHKYEIKLKALKTVIHENGLDYYEHINRHRPFHSEIELKK